MMNSDVAELAALTPELLTTVLRQDIELAGVRVTGVDAAPVGSGQMARSFLLELTFDGDRSAAPQTLVAKLPSDDETSRAMAARTGAYVREVRFYDRVAPRLSVRAPRCWHASLDGDGFVLLLEDMGPAAAIDQLGGCEADSAALALDQAARLHGCSWEAPWLANEGWLPVAAIWRQLGGAIPQVVATFLARFGDHLEPEHVAVVERLARDVGRWLDTLDDHRCMWHGDFRLDNLLYDGQDGSVPVTVVDWQSAAVGPGVIDVPYFLGTSLEVDDRRKHERDLVAAYHDALLAHGARDYTWEDCLREYRAHSLYGLVLTVPVSLSVEQTERGDRMFGTMARRAAAQIADNDAFEALPR